MESIMPQVRTYAAITSINESVEELGGNIHQVNKSLRVRLAKAIAKYLTDIPGHFTPELEAQLNPLSKAMARVLLSFPQGLPEGFQDDNILVEPWVVAQINEKEQSSPLSISELLEVCREFTSQHGDYISIKNVNSQTTPISSKPFSATTVEEEIFERSFYLGKENIEGNIENILYNRGQQSMAETHDDLMADLAFGVNQAFHKGLFEENIHTYNQALNAMATIVQKCPLAFTPHGPTREGIKIEDLCTPQVVKWINESYEANKVIEPESLAKICIENREALSSSPTKPKQ